ncbi:MAG TPA: alpha/beta hydrolase, partial [Armatimonadaceae bacterium]|nr:alpha/beta hydrolase [Armatimonadaceae bacterium]
MTPPFRPHGPPPYRVAVLHGGPGAPGSAAPVARELARRRGVLEPFQAADSVAGQVAELRDLLVWHAEPPVVLVGPSWGAMLALLFAAEHPDLVAKLVLVGSSPLEASYAAGILDARLARLSEAERAEARNLMDALKGDDGRADAGALERLGALFGGTDAYDPLPGGDGDTLEVQQGVYENVWGEAAWMREQGAFAAAAARLRCPVVVLHGDHDPHPADGVREPLERAGADVRFALLPRCGHEPWSERQARERFFTLLDAEMPAARKGAVRRDDVPPDILAGLNAGELETASLSEDLAVDLAAVVVAVAREASAHVVARLGPKDGVTRRMAVIGEALAVTYGADGYDRFAGHRSNVVRGFAAYLLAALPRLTLTERLERVRPLADDRHYGVREWAWLALRPHVAADVDASTALLTPWTADGSANVRR